MKIFKTKVEVDTYFSENMYSKIGFIPTMGALHEGHTSLVKKAKDETEIVIVSIFINPTQFNNESDFLKYPKTIESDIEILGKVLSENDVLFYPNYEEVYSEEVKTNLDFGILENVMEGKFRPGHFKGVGMVVDRLFDIVKPTMAFFGEKDYQQLAVIKELEKRRNSGILIVECPTKRSEIGLALSSRNQRLSKEQLESASKIFKGMVSIKQNIFHSKSINEIKDEYISFIEDDDNLKVEYINIADEKTFLELTGLNNLQNARIFTAVFCGDVRLIDNMKIV